MTISRYYFTMSSVSLVLFLKKKLEIYFSPGLLEDFPFQNKDDSEPLIQI